MVYVSPDGRSWSRVHREESGQPYHCFAFSGTQYVIGMANGQVLSSVDLVDWSMATLPNTIQNSVIPQFVRKLKAGSAPLN